MYSHLDYVNFKAHKIQNSSHSVSKSNEQIIPLPPNEEQMASKYMKKKSSESLAVREM